ncbi:MAG: DNA recombination protein RmuC [Roseiarcus sp.]
MNVVLTTLGDHAVTLGEALAAAGAALLTLALALVVALIGRGRGGRALEARLERLAEASAETQGRLHTLGEWLGSRQGDLARLLAERLDTNTKTTGETLARLNERLAVIDAAQTRIAGMTEAVASLRDVLANKQARGAFGQGRMEAIVRDGLPAGGYEFQATLSNDTRPDCIVRMPGDPRPLVIDAKFPLEAFAALSTSRDEEARRIAAQRVRVDVLRHVKDIAERYLLSGETQDIALMFVPSESIFADLVEHFDDVVQRAHRARVVIVSPSLLRMAIEVAQIVTRDARLHETAHLLRAEVGKLIDDARRLAERAAKLEAHFRQAQDDVSGIVTSAAKIDRRASRIESIEFAPAEPTPDAAELKLAE